MRVPAIPLKIEHPNPMDSPISYTVIDVSKWQPTITFPEIGKVADVTGSDGMGTYTILWENETNKWEVNNVDLYSGSVLGNSGSGNSGGEYTAGQGYSGSTVGHGLYGDLPASEYSWVRDTYNAFKQRLRG